ncbi:MAG: histidinol phosphate phosphatase, partial [Fusobacterium sp.]|nr:histidinol phosphate phosphatase [Fusobacterium sp.]
MKKIFDQHMHSNFSFDSQESIENYIKITKDNDIVTTEHNDFAIPHFNFKDMLLNYEKYSAKINELNQKYDNKFFKGIEIDFLKSKEKEILGYLSEKEFDLKLLSI